MEFVVKKFDDLTIYELYQILQLRSEVFVVEQNCAYQDIDGEDKIALHIFGFKDDKIVAYSRIFKSGDYFDNSSISRVVIAKSERKYGYGHELMESSIKAIEDSFNATKITISAQSYLKKFYETHKFTKIGEGYLEDGIPHIRMLRK